MLEEILTLQDSIIHKKQFEQYECHICFSIALKPAECAGPCHKKFCTKCVSDWKRLQDRCPLKCSQPFFVRCIPTPQITFMCPFSPSMCNVVLKNMEEFEDHFEECQFISENQRKQKILMKESKCRQGHELEFFLGTYEQMCESTCSSCKQMKLCRSICRICNQVYCVYCRPPLCSKEGCPLGHKLNYQQWNQVGYICDLCGISTSISNHGVYDDPACNFGLCEQCFKNLPAEVNHKQSRPRNPYKCNKGHQLLTQFPQKSKQKCNNCLKTKYCPKRCLQCSEQYCLQCKAGIICEALRCKDGHYLEKQVSLHQGKQCIKCLTITTIFYTDLSCQFSLCQQCIEYEHMILSNKSRFIEQVNCNKGHLLKFFSGEDQVINQCFSCKQNKIIRLFCDCCSDQMTYCCECRPLTNKQLCYFGHNLQMHENKQMLHCSLCGANQKQFRKCHKCNYCICLKCCKQQEQKKKGKDQQDQQIEQKQNKQ